MAWVESVSPSFQARHELDDADEAARVLEQLERTRDRLAPLFPETPGELDVVVHGSEAALALAQPLLPLARRLTAPASRRYLVGWATRRELHVLAPRAAARRASRVPGSRELLTLAPAALYARRVVAANNPVLPPPWTPARAVRAARWWWLLAGAGQLLSGQVDHLRPAVLRRLREGRPPAFPPAGRDAELLGGTVLELLRREQGLEAVVGLCRAPLRGRPDDLLAATFGRPLAGVEADWRRLLEET